MQDLENGGLYRKTKNCKIKKFYMHVLHKCLKHKPCCRQTTNADSNRHGV